MLHDPYPEIGDAARRHAEADYPNESVGIVTRSGAYVPLVNIHANPFESFAISDDDALAYRDDTAALIHSHCLRAEDVDPLDGPLMAGPSVADMQQQQAMMVPWGIVTVIDKVSHETILWFGDQLPIAPLIGRQFIHGIHDCYSLIRDAYRGDEFGFIKQHFGRESILLPDQPRDFDWWADRRADGTSVIPGNLYMDHFAQAGFRSIAQTDLRPGDVFLAQVGAPVVNHGGLYLGNNLIAHHLRRRLSKREPGARWIEYMTLFLRYEGV